MMNQAHALILSGILAAGCAQSHGAANTISDGSPVAPPGAPHSTFVSLPGEDGFGKDPFHPRTTRFIKQSVKVENPTRTRPTVPESIVLKGISFVAGRKLAIINNYTVAEGEGFSLRIDGSLIKGQCVEIKEKGVVIKVNGEIKEIPLRSILQ